MRRASKIPFALLLVSAALFGAILWTFVKQSRAKSDFNALMKNPLGVSYNAPTLKSIRWLCNLTDPHLMDNARYRNYRDEVCTFFSRPVESITICGFTGFRSDPDSILSRFTQLRKFYTLESTGGAPNEDDLAQLSKMLKSAPKLRVIEFKGQYISDVAIAPLAGHPSLETVCVQSIGLTPACIGTFTSMPHLSRLEIKRNAKVFQPEGIKDVQAALPKVTVEFR